MAKIVLFTWFFFCIVKQICHRDLKLENTLLDGSTAPRVKICDFGYSKVLLEPSLLWLLVCCLIAVIFLIYIMQHDNWYDHSVLYCSGLLTVKKKTTCASFTWFTVMLFSELFLQSSLLHSQPKSTVGTPAYIAPEVFMNKYNGKVFSIPSPWCFKLPSDIRCYQPLPTYAFCSTIGVRLRAVKSLLIFWWHE